MPTNCGTMFISFDYYECKRKCINSFRANLWCPLRRCVWRDVHQLHRIHLSFRCYEIEYILATLRPMRLMSASEWKWYDLVFVILIHCIFAAIVNSNKFVVDSIYGYLAMVSMRPFWTVSDSSGTLLFVIAWVLCCCLTLIWSSRWKYTKKKTKMVQCKFRL